MPFFKFCFGAKNFPDTNEETEEKEFHSKFEKFVIEKMEYEHNFNSLFQIGSELLLQIILDDKKKFLNEEFRKKFSYG